VLKCLDLPDDDLARFTTDKAATPIHVCRCVLAVIEVALVLHTSVITSEWIRPPTPIHFCRCAWQLGAEVGIAVCLGAAYKRIISKRIGAVTPIHVCRCTWQLGIGLVLVVHTRTATWRALNDHSGVWVLWRGPIPV
jgi:hypothetical protein